MIPLLVFFLVPDLPYRDCTIENISDVSHDTKLYTLALPPGCRMCVPLGYHVHIRHTVEGIYIVLLHSYKCQMIKTGHRVEGMLIFTQLT